jgi:Skp family chaperone for outer membrane proteins
MTTKMLGIVSAMAMMAASAAASAQTAPAAAPAPAITQGPAIPGVCLMSVQQAIQTSQVGQYVGNRMSQIVQQVKAELGPEDTAINTDGKALEAARPTLDRAAFDSRARALQSRVEVLRQKASQRQAEVEATEKKALNRIAQELDPIARQLYQQRHCSILVDKGSVMMANPEMDLTASAVTALNGRIQQFAFDREHLDTAPAAR